MAANIEELEKRLLYSADLPGADLALAPHDQTEATHAEFGQSADTDVAVASQSFELLIVDARTPDYQRLIDGFQADDERRFEVVILDAGKSGVEQISAALVGHQDVTAIHLVSHGAAGELTLGTDILNNQSLLSHAEAVARWGEALTNDGDLLIYGCDLASTQDGESFINTLSQLTGADIAASNDATGTGSDADWVLEYETGEIEADIAIASSAQVSWIYTLGTPTAATDAFAIDQDTPTVIDPRANDTEPEGDSLDIIDVTQPADGSVVKNGDGTLTYSPNASYSGSDSFDYMVMDAGSSMAHYWGFNGDAVDSVGGTDGTRYGTNSVSGEFGSALDFDENNDRVDVPDFSYNNEFTISFDFKLDDNFGSGFQYLFSHGDINGQDSINVFISESGYSGPSGSNHMKTVVRDTNDSLDNDALDFNIGGIVGDGQWHTYTLIVEQGIGAKVYLDGIQQNSDSRGGDAFNPSGSLYIGARQDLNADRYFGGGLDSVMIFDKALSSGEVGSLAAHDNVASVNLTVAANTAPVLTGANDLTAINEDDFTSSGTLVSMLTAGQVTDSDVGDPSGIAVIAVDDTNGTWQYTTDGGSNWYAFGAVDTSSARLLAADASTKVRFVPDADWNGTVGNGITFHAWDQTSGTAGGTADLSSTIRAVRDDFTSVAYSNNDGTANWTSNWTETSDDGAASTGNIRIESAALTLDNVDGGAFEGITRELDLAGASSATLSFDYGGYAFSGTDSFAIAVSNDSGSSWTQLENIAFVDDPGTNFSGSRSYDLASYLGLTGNMVLRFEITSGFGGAGQHVAFDNVQIEYIDEPDIGGSSAFSAATASGSITVNPVNDAPTVATNTGTTVAEGSTGNTVTTAMLNEGDVDDDGAGLTYTLTSAPTNGTLRLSGTALGISDTFTQADIDAGNLTYDHDGSETVADSFGFSLADGGEDGATAASGTFSITVSPINDSPSVATNTGATVAEGSTGNTVTTAMLNEGDVDDDGAGLAYTLTSAPGNGTLRLSGAALGVSDTFTQADIDAGNLTYDHDGSETLSDSFGFSLADGGEDGATAATGTFSITVTPVNDAPVLDNSADPALTDIFENDDRNSGTLVSDIIASAGGDRITDADSGAVEGIAITSVDDSNGQWQFSTDGGGTWNPITGAADNSAVLLTTTANDRVRFLPDWNFSGSADFSFRAWDTSDGNTTGTTGVDASGNGGSTAFSTAVETASLSIVGTDVKILLSTYSDASSTNTDGLSGWSKEEIVAVGDPNFNVEPGTSSGTFTLISSYLQTAGDGNVRINALHYVSRDIDIGLSSQISLLAGDMLVVVDGTETLTGSDLSPLTVDNQDVFVFRPDTPGNFSSGRFFTLLDDFAGAEMQGLSLVEKDVNIGGQNLSTGSFIYSKNSFGEQNNIYHYIPDHVGPGNTTGSSTLLIDGDDISLGSSFIPAGSLDLVQDDITVNGKTFLAGDILVSLAFSDSSVGSGTPIAVSQDDIFALRVSQAGATTVAEAIPFFEAEEAGLGSFGEQIWSLASIISVGDLNPTLTLPGGALAYTENDPATVLDAGATLTDPDSINFYNGQLRVEITDNGSAGDRLAINHQGTGAGQVGVSGNLVSYEGVNIGSFTGGAATGSPLVITFNSNSTVAGVQAVLRNITFENVSDAPSTLNRTVELILTDGDGGTSNIVTKTVTVTAVDDPVVATDDAYSVAENGVLTTGAAWWNSGWTARRELSFDNLDRAEALTDFVVLVKLDSTRIDYGLTQNAGQDLRFVDADGVTVLDHEIEEWNEGGTSYVWVRVPQIDAASDSDSIWMYYGNAAAADGQNADGTWGTDYAGVYHLHDDFQDSSGSGNHATNAGSTDTGGQLADGQLFDGIDDDINAGSAASLDNIFNGGGTLSAWIRPTGWGGSNYGNIMDKSSATDADGGWGLQVNAGNQSIDLEVGFTGGDRGVWSTPTGSVTLGEWHHVVVTYDSSSTANVPVIYIDGVAQDLTQTDTPAGSADDDSAKDFHIGNFAGATTRAFDGTIDEARIAGVAQSADWTSAEYAAMTDTLVSFGKEGVLANDTDPDTEYLTVTAINPGTGFEVTDTVQIASGVTLPSGAIVSISPDGRISYDPNGQYESLASGATAIDTFTYQVTDGNGGTDTATVTITINGENDAPGIATNSGTTVDEDSSGNVISSLMLDEGDVDDDGAELTYTVTSVTANGTLRLSGSALGLNDTFTQDDIDSGRLTYDHDGSETVSDSFGFSLADGGEDGATAATGTFNITVTPVNDAPVIDTGNLSVAENQTAAGTVTGSDADLPADTLTWSLAGTGADDGLFSIDPGTGALTFDAAPDFDVPGDADGDNVYEVRVQLNDGTTTTVKDITVTLSNVDEFDVGAVTDSDGSGNAVNENATIGTAVGITAQASDDDLPDTITYSLNDNDGGRFAIDANTGVVTVAGAIDREADGATRSITVRATSADGSFTEQAFTIDINDVDEFDVSAPSDSDGTANAVDENAANGTTVGITAQAADNDATTNTVTYSLFDDAGGRFAIDANTGVVTVADGTLLDREAAASHDITVRATSADGSTADTVFTVSLNDIDEFDVTAPSDGDASADAVDENAANGTTVGITASATDDDATINAATYSLFDDAGGRFAIDANTGIVTVADGTLLDREAAASHDITIRATSADGSTADTVFTISLNDLDEFDVGAVTDIDVTANSVAEDAGVGTSVGITASASDGDATTNAITYSLDDDAGGLFAINGSTGEVTVNAGLDYETATSHSITVRATSADGSSSTQSFTIDVTDVNESAVGAISDNDGTADAVQENSPNGTPVGVTASASDPDGTDTVSYSLDSDAGGRFAIDANTGVITVAGGIDREASGSYDVTVRATSTDTSFSTRIFTISIGDVDEFDVTNPSDSDATANAVDENAANGTTVGITATASDSDATTNTLTYSLADDAGGRFAIDANTGIVTVADGTLLDHETSTSHDITVRATSTDGSTADTLFTVTVTDVNEAPTAISLSNNAVDENTDTSGGYGVGTLATSDVDAGDSAAYSIVGGVDSALFSIGGPGSDELVLSDGVLDFEGQTSYEVTVRSTDSGGLTHDQTFTITVNDLNEAPAFGSAPSTSATEDVNYSYSITTNDPEAGDSWTISAPTLPAWLTLIDHGDGSATLSGTPDYAEVGDHSVLLQVADQGGLTGTQSFTITVSNVNDAPVITSDGGGPAASLGVLENSTTVTTVTATDVDGDTPSYSVVGGADMARFAIDSATGQLSFLLGPDFENPGDADADGVYQVVVQAADGNGGSDQQALQIAVNDQPVALLADQVIAGSESASDGLILGQLQTSGDRPTSFVITGGNAAGAFAVDQSGRLSVVDASALAAGANSYELQVEVSDGSTTSSQGITVQVQRAVPTDSTGNPPPDDVPPPPIDPYEPIDIDPPGEGETEVATEEREPSTATDPGDSASEDRRVIVGTLELTPAEIALAGDSGDDGRSTEQRVFGAVPLFARVVATKLLIEAGVLELGTGAVAFTPFDPEGDDAALWNSLDGALADLEAFSDGSDEDTQLVVEAAGAAALSLTVGFVVWVLRTGALAASLLSMSPIWRHIDPLPVLPGSDEDEHDWGLDIGGESSAEDIRRLDEVPERRSVRGLED